MVAKRDASLDDLDRRLLALLGSDARAPLASLAAHLKVSRGTVQNRIARLISSGVLLGFTTRMRREIGATAVRAIAAIELTGHDMKRGIGALRTLPEITAIHTTNGRWDLILEIAAPDLPALDRVLREIRAIREVANSETNILLTHEK